MGYNCFNHTVAVTVNRLMTWSFLYPNQETQLIKSKSNIFQNCFGYVLFKSTWYLKNVMKLLLLLLLLFCLTFSTLAC